MAQDWIAAYKRYVGPEPGGRGKGTGDAGPATVPGLNLPASPDRQPDVAAPIPAARARSETPAQVASPVATTVPKAGQPAAQVWVNTKSGVYHGSASRYYGKTKGGKFMAEVEALAAGFHAAPGNQ